jgi:hypothetical protein
MTHLYYVKKSRVHLLPVFLSYDDEVYKMCLLMHHLLLFYYRKTYALVSNQVCKPGFCIRRRSGTHVIPTLARGE